MEQRVSIQWTTTAKNQLAELPLSVRRAILSKADGLRKCSDPKRAYKQLKGPLQGYYRFAVGRYRAIYEVVEEKLTNGDVWVKLIIRFVAVGQRKEHDRKDVYEIAKRAIDLGIIPPHNLDD